MAHDISIVIGAQNAKSTIAQCLGSLLEQMQSIDGEVVVADSSTDGTGTIVEKQFPHVTLIRTTADKLVPHLWGIGIERAQAPLVGLTTAHCIPAPDWVRTILAEAQTHADFAGFGGAIAPPEKLPAKDWAVYFSRYSNFMPPAKPGPVNDIPGDNAAYRKEALDVCWNDRDQGFWETLFHRALRQSGRTIYMSPAVNVKMGHTDSAWDYFWVRFKHGRHYGSTRPDTGMVGRILRIIAAPILMPYLVLRIGKRVAQQRQDFLPKYVIALPWLIFFMSGWSLGELVGYLRPQCHAAI